MNVTTTLKRCFKVNTYSEKNCFEFNDLAEGDDNPLLLLHGSGDGNDDVEDNDDDDEDAAAMSLGKPAAESVWLLAGRTEASYTALRDALSREVQTREDGQDQEQGERLCHMLTLGPSAAGGEAAAASRLKR